MSNSLHEGETIDFLHFGSYFFSESVLHLLTKTRDYSNQSEQFSEQPLVPVGCLTTAYFLGSGIRSFYDRDASRSQKMMRLRVGAQFATLMIFIGYAGMESFNLAIAPGYHPKDDKDKK